MKKLLLLYLAIIGAYVLYALNYIYGRNQSRPANPPGWSAAWTRSTSW